MEDIVKKRKKIDWLDLIHSFNYEKEFNKFCKDKKIKNRNRLGYMFIKHIKGRDFVACLRRISNDRCCKDELVRIAHTNWISED